MDPHSHEPGPPQVPSDLALKTAELALKEVGVRETDGPNDSPRIREYQAAVGIGPPQPYCAAFTSWAVQEAALRTSYKPLFRSSGGALHLLEINATLRMPAPTVVPCVAVFDHGGGRGHVAIVLELLPDGKMKTVEANTRPTAAAGTPGSREGDGVYVRSDRLVADVHGFIRIA